MPGSTLEQLLDAADRDLYANKAKKPASDSTGVVKPGRPASEMLVRRRDSETGDNRLHPR
jgi:hypothetical protein